MLDESSQTSIADERHWERVTVSRPSALHAAACSISLRRFQCTSRCLPHVRRSASNSSPWHCCSPPSRPTDRQAALQLTCEQVDQLAAARSAFLAGMGEVCVERRELLGCLAALQVPPAFKVLQQINALWLEVGC